MNLFMDIDANMSEAQKTAAISSRVNKLAAYVTKRFKMPDEVRAELVEAYDDLDSRNTAALVTCFVISLREAGMSEGLINELMKKSVANKNGEDPMTKAYTKFCDIHVGMMALEGLEQMLESRQRKEAESTVKGMMK